MSDKESLPTSQELAELPTRALVAYAWRAAKRVQPIYEFDNDEEDKYRHILALAQVLHHARDFVQNDKFDSERYKIKYPGIKLNTHSAIIYAEKFDRPLMRTYAAETIESLATLLFSLFDMSHANASLFASNMTQGYTGKTKVAAILDYQNLLKLNLGRNEETFDPSENGPLGTLWPAGQPEWWLEKLSAMNKAIRTGSEMDSERQIEWHKANDDEYTKRMPPDDDLISFDIFNKKAYKAKVSIDLASDFTTKEIEATDPSPLISVFFQGNSISPEDKILFSQYLSELYKEGGGSGLKLVDSKELEPERAEVM